MKLFLDSSVLLAASGSSTGASRLLVEMADAQGWTLVSSAYCAQETEKNLPKLGDHAVADFLKVVAPHVLFHETTWVLDRPMVYGVVKDKPVLVTALALKCEALLTLDRGDFQKMLGAQMYGLWILTPGDWIRKVRQASEK